MPPAAVNAPIAAQVIQGDERPLTPLYDLLAHRAVAAWFLFAALTVAWGIAKTASGLDRSTIQFVDIADLLSRISLLAFLVSAAWFSLMRAKPLGKAPGVMPRIVALLGASLIYGIPFLPRLEEPPVWLLVLATSLAAAGNLLAAIVISRLGKSFSVMSEARRLVTGGPYRLVRHPLYLTEEIAIIGCFLPYWSLPALALFLSHLVMQLLRMRNEEAVLRATFPDYAEYARHTNRLIPGIW